MSSFLVDLILSSSEQLDIEKQGIEKQVVYPAGFTYVFSSSFHR